MSHRSLHVTTSVTNILVEPEVSISVDPITGELNLKVTVQCSTCQGYGSPCRECHGPGRTSQDVKPDNLRDVLGHEGATRVFMALREMTDKIDLRAG